MYYNKNDLSIYYEKHGKGSKTILILPGWGETRATFHQMIKNLENHFTIYIFDYPGFGRSIFPDRDLTIYDYANIIRDFIEDENIKHPYIIAHSFGGRIATLIAGYYQDEVDKLVMIDVAGIKPKKKIGKRIKASLYRLLKNLNILLPKNKRSLYLKKLLKKFGSNDYGQLNSYMYESFKNIVNEDLISYLNYIECDTLLIWGKLDKDTPLADGKKMNKRIKHSSLIVFEQGGHFSYLDYPNSTLQLIKNFFLIK